LVETHRDEIKEIVARHKGVDVAIFGSVARGDETPESDIDFLIGLERSASLFDLGRILCDLRDLLGRKVDVVDRDALRPEDDDIRQDAVRL
jgi:predicted nucleotidyltransferase